MNEPDTYTFVVKLIGGPLDGTIKYLTRLPSKMLVEYKGKVEVYKYTLNSLRYTWDKQLKE